MPCPGYIWETIRCRKLIFGRDIGRGYRGATSWCDLDLTYDLAYLMLFYLSHILLLESWLLHHPIVTDGITSSESQVLPQLHI